MESVSNITGSCCPLKKEKLNIVTHKVLFCMFALFKKLVKGAECNTNPPLF